ncbi:MAG: LysM peptidoglycan-binding domain-containing protein, partial [Thermoanaerobaculia bacterium]|nr:LysM peptidoglycan-binding domain-containing protein [Thermoanaerobaculia bacterium]
RRSTIQSSFNRSAPWIPMIEQVLAAYGLPADLAYLPVIESGYRTSLTSTAGAHGMWQFMAPTAREYGLRVDWWVDERADPWKSTRAAAHYLSDLYRIFGDWPLALAAYNCGPGCVGRALERENATTFWELLDKKALPKETRGYVPTFYATIALAARPQEFGFTLPNPYDNLPDSVTIHGPVSLDYLASEIGLDADLFRSLNVELHRGIVPPEPWSLRVPFGTSYLFSDRAWNLEDPSMSISSHTVTATESLESFAQRVGASARELRAMNGLRSDTIAAGEVLWLPVRQTELAPRLNSRASGDGWYVVKPGDTLYSIAKRNGLTVEELAELNRLGTDRVIHPGDRLTVRIPPATTGGM